MKQQNVPSVELKLAALPTDNVDFKLLCPLTSKLVPTFKLLCNTVLPDTSNLDFKLVSPLTNRVVPTVTLC